MTGTNMMWAIVGVATDIYSYFLKSSDRTAAEKPAAFAVGFLAPPAGIEPTTNP